MRAAGHRVPRGDAARPRVIAVVGATASGKSDLGEELAAALCGEIVCADSRQVFRELEIGTGKPDPASRAERPHHLFEALALGQRGSAGWYAAAAREACEAILARGATPVLVGGSGLYLRALMEGLSAEPPHDAVIRERLRAQASREGAEALHAALRAVDPPTAARLEPGDVQRVSRALEVHEASGRPLSWWHALPRHPALEADWRLIELVVPPADLARRIERRTLWMFGSGLVEEAALLRERGLEPALRALRAVGYDEALDLIDGRLARVEAEARTTLRTRQLAKRQRTWFRHQVQAVRLAAGGGSVAAQLRECLEAVR
jgi:tRNA dimethylallyltransferase